MKPHEPTILRLNFGFLSRRPLIKGAKVGRLVSFLIPYKPRFQVFSETFFRKNKGQPWQFLSENTPTAAVENDVPTMD